MTFNDFIKRVTGVQRNDLGAPVLRMIILATRRVMVVPLAPCLLKQAVSA